MVSLRFREFLTGYVAEEFDSLVAQLRSFFSVSFNEDGTLQGLDTGLTSVPIGAISQYAGATAPAGWLLCRGDAVSRVTYKSLYEVIGTTYGAGDGSTTFNLPDLQQRFPLGKAAAGTGAALGATGGTIDHTHGGLSHTHTISTAADHSHTVGSHTHDISSDGSHTHSGTTEATVFGATGFTSGFVGGVTDAHTHPFTTGSSGDHDHGGATALSASAASGDAGSHDHGGVTGSGGGTTDSANPPFLALNFIILAGA